MSAKILLVLGFTACVAVAAIEANMRPDAFERHVEAFRDLASKYYRCGAKDDIRTLDGFYGGYWSYKHLSNEKKNSPFKERIENLFRRYRPFVADLEKFEPYDDLVGEFKQLIKELKELNAEYQEKSQDDVTKLPGFRKGLEAYENLELMKKRAALFESFDPRFINDAFNEAGDLIEELKKHI